MNSISYLSKLAATPRAPGTPRSNDDDEKPERHEELKWHRLFLPPRTPRRSSPSAVSSTIRVQQPSSESRISVHLHADGASQQESSLKFPTLDSGIRRSLISKVLVLAWKVLCAAWTSLSASNLLERPPDLIASPSEAPIPLLVTPSDPDTPSIQVGNPRSQAVVATPHHLRSSPEPSSQSSSRSASTSLAARRSPLHLPKTLVLDLDETLIHSTSRPIHTDRSSWLGFRTKELPPGYTVQVMLGGRSTQYHVYKRPFADFFLRTVSSWYTLVIFTASMQEYADPVIDWLDGGRGILTRRHFRDSCTQLPNGSYTKDLSIIEDDLSRVCLVDNSPISYRVNQANGIPIEGWTHDPSDEALLDLLPVLDSLRFTSDVRRVLGLRCAGTHLPTT